MQCFHEFASMWTINANYKNNFFSDIFRAAFQRVCETFLRGFQSVSTIPSVSMHFKRGFQRVSKRFERVSKGFQSVSKGFQSILKGFQKGFQRVSKRLQRVSKAFPKGFKPSETRFPKGFRVTSNPLKNAFVDKTCFRMEGHICSKGRSTSFEDNKEHKEPRSNNRTGKRLGPTS